MILYVKYDDYSDNHCDNHCDKNVELELHVVHTFLSMPVMYTAILITIKC